MHCFKNCDVFPDIRPRRKSQSSDEAGNFIGKDVSEHVGCKDDVELRRVKHQLHSTVIDDAVLQKDVVSV